MNTSRRAWILVLLFPLFIVSCNPVAGTNTASISGGVYFDCDKDGACADDETGIAGMPIRLYFGACGENLVQTHETDQDGEFLFSGLAPGNYCVFPDFEIKTCGYGGNAPTTAISRRVTLVNGMRSDVVWFGFGVLSGEPED